MGDGACTPTANSKLLEFLPKPIPAEVKDQFETAYTKVLPKRVLKLRRIDQKPAPLPASKQANVPVQVAKPVSKDLSKKFSMGFQILYITGLDNIDCKDGIIRLVALDIFPDSRTILFTTSKLEAGEEDAGLYGWQFGSLTELPAVVNGDVVGRAPVDLFKLHFQEAYDINDGAWRLPIQLSDPVFARSGAGGNSREPFIHVRIYKPKFGAPTLQRFTPRLITPPVTEEAYIHVPVELVEETIPPAHPVSVCIDGLRFLPVNATISKVHARFYSTYRRRYLKPFEINQMVNLDKPVYSPSIGAFKSIPFSALDRTCLLVIRVYTIEFFSGQMELVGTAVHPMFVDAATGEQPTPTSEKIIPNLGAFQLPIYNDRLGTNFFQTERDVHRVIRVPCSTVLIRILSTEPASQLVDYASRVYQTAPGNEIAEYEQHIYQFVLMERRGFSIRDRILSLGDAIPKTARHTEASLAEWLKKRMELGADSKLKIKEIDLSFITAYNPNYGFKISIDYARNLTHKGSTFAITSFTPNYFKLGEQNKSQFFPDEFIYTKCLDTKSEFKNPQWNDGFHWYRGRPSSGDLLAVIQLLSISIPQSSGIAEINSQGWTIIPIFASQDYVRHGQFKLPLYSGYPTDDVFIECWKDGDWELEDGIHSKLLAFTPKFASVTVRVCDGRRSAELNPAIAPISTEFLSGFDAKFKPGGSSQSIISLKPKTQPEQEYNVLIDNAFVEATGLPYIP
ncbi:Coiled-coil domain-containing protein 17 [Kappamyces sp. JEL0680]|nr:Coiled-coil domain-containing protein 17 [Kappamyces sp. JEL0680]